MITSPLKAIRAKCVECCESIGEIPKCPVSNCPLHPFRMGKNPYRKPRVYTEAELERKRQTLINNRKKN